MDDKMVLNVKINSSHLPLYLEYDDIARTLLLCLEHRRGTKNVFDIVPEAKLYSINDKTPEGLILDRISPRVAKSTHGPALMPLNLHESKVGLLELKNIYSLRKDEQLSKELQFIPDPQIPEKYYITPNTEMFLTHYFYLLQKFARQICSPCKNLRFR
jgi:hypothetical protein